MGRKDGLPLPRKEGLSVEVRAVDRRDAGDGAGDDRRHGGGSGLQLTLVQPRAEPGKPSVSTALFVSFTKHLVRHTVSQDALYLAITAAGAEVDASPEELKALARKVKDIHSNSNVYPEGF